MVMAAIGCRYDPYHNSYLKQIPPTDDLCGVWIIHANETTWGEARRIVDAGKLGPDQAFLKVEPNGQFTVANVPGVLYLGLQPITNEVRASGTWETRLDAQGLAYMGLRFETLNGEPVEQRYRALSFRSEGGNLLLHIGIGDPDSGNVVVLRRTDK
jgi:hypothetical protein